MTDDQECNNRVGRIIMTLQFQSVPEDDIFLSGKLAYVSRQYSYGVIALDICKNLDKMTSVNMLGSRWTES